LAGEAGNFSHPEMGERWQGMISAGSFPEDAISVSMRKLKFINDTEVSSFLYVMLAGSVKE
jgi:hypothetical protein